MSITNDLEYRTRAMIEVTSAGQKTEISDKADEMKLKDYQEASDKEDATKNYVVADVVGTESIVILSSETPSGEGGIFRSKFKLADSGIPALVEGLQGKKVGDKVEVTMNNQVHTVTLHGIRENAPQAEEQPTLQ